MNSLEKDLIRLISIDRFYTPVSSMHGKLERRRSNLAKTIDAGELGDSFEGNRVHARIETKDEMKARGVKKGIEEFSRIHPKYGKILQDMIKEKREESETHLYFGMYEGCRLTRGDYIEILEDLGFSGSRAITLYQELIYISRHIIEQRGEQRERRIMIG